MLVIYVDGRAAVRARSAGPVATGASQGIYIGGAAPDHPPDLYVGQLDELRLFSVARNAQQICADAGRAQCM